MWSTKQLMTLSKETLVKGLFPSSVDFAPEEAARFFDILVDESVMKNNARIVQMAKATKNLRAVGLGGQKVLHPAATFHADEYIRGIKQQRIQLVAKKARGMVLIPDDDLEDNVEGEAFANHLMELIAKTCSNELEEAWIIGDVADPATCLNEMWNGWYTVAIDSAGAGAGDVIPAAHVLDADSYGSQYIWELKPDSPYGYSFIFKKMIHALPHKYRRDRTKLRFLVSPGIDEDWRSAIEARGTSVGDEVLLKGGALSCGNIPIVPVPGIPENQGGGADRTFIMLTHYENLIAGLLRELRLETERRAGDEATAVWLSIRGDVTVENVDAMVVAKNLKVKGE